MTSSPFGKLATIVAAVAALGILGGWLASQVGLVAGSAELNTAALVVIGVIFGVGAGAATVANGAVAQSAIANTRLDAIGAPSAHLATEIVHSAATAAGSNSHAAPPPDSTPPPPGGGP